MIKPVYTTKEKLSPARLGNIAAFVE